MYARKSICGIIALKLGPWKKRRYFTFVSNRPLVLGDDLRRAWNYLCGARIKWSVHVFDNVINKRIERQMGASFSETVQTFSNDLTRGLCMRAPLFCCGQLLNYGGLGLNANAAYRANKHTHSGEARIWRCRRVLDLGDKIYTFLPFG